MFCVVQEMEARFLAGMDPGIDYSAIDADSRLDEHWATLVTRDAEEAYFQGVGDSEQEEGGVDAAERKEEYDY